MNQIKIAFIPLQRLGDGIISLVLANNLHKNNYHITMFHDSMQQINDWFDFDIQTYPDHNEIEQKLKDFDIVLMDMCTPYVLSKTEEQQIELSKKYIFYAVGDIEAVFVHDHSKRLIKQLGNEHYSLFEAIARACRTIKFGNNDSMVDNMMQYCQKTLQLKQVSNQTGLKIPAYIHFRKHPQRVVIAPTSSLEKKNWHRKKFILLARLLKEKGYHPIFAVATHEWRTWNSILNNEFELPKFTTIKSYAEYLHESLAFIGNDSGGGHVASMMGVPVITLVSSPRKINYKWRPGWGKNSVVAPNFTFKLLGRRYWQAFLSVQKVYQAFEDLIGQ